MNNLNHISRLLFSVEWEDLNEEERKTCAIWESNTDII
jgi:hypothetical protein